MQEVVVFDVLFIFQHYVFYLTREQDEAEGGNRCVEDQNIEPLLNTLQPASES